MSGGHFGYQQYKIEDIAEHLEKDIADIEYARSIGKIQKKNVYAHLVDAYNGQKSWANWLTEMTCRYDNCEDLVKELKKRNYIFDRGGKLFIDDCKGLYEIVISDGETEEWADGNWHFEIEDPEVLEEFKKGLKILKTAAIYAQRIDWLLSGDDGEESFKSRLKEELDILDSKPLIDYEHWNNIREENRTE